MTPRVRFLLAAILLLLFCVDFAWATAIHANVDYGKLLRIALFSLVPISVGIVYSTWRPDERVPSVMFAIAFLLLLAPLCNLLNYLAITIAGPRIDDLLASYDRALGINWADLVTLIARHPWAIHLLGGTYKVSAFQVALAIAVLGYKSDARDISLVCIATVICAWTSIAFWTAWPSFGAYTVYDLSAIGHRLGVVIDRSYPDFLIWVLSHGPGRIDVLNAKGLIGFPSFHTEELIIAWWCLRKQKLVFILISIFSLITLVSVPVQGGHHVVDVIGGFAFAAPGIWAASRILQLLDHKVPGRETAALATSAVD